MSLDCRPFRVKCADGTSLTSSALVIATGARAKWLGVPGEQELLSRGVCVSRARAAARASPLPRVVTRRRRALSRAFAPPRRHTCATCDGYFYKGRRVAVVGGGDTAMEQALFLARLGARVTVVHRKAAFRASKAMAARVLGHAAIDVAWGTVVREFVAAPAGGAPGAEPALARLRVADAESGEERELEVDGAFVAIGHVPNTQLFGDALRKDEHGYVYTIPGTTVTSVRGVYAAGDVQDAVYRQAITSAGTGAMAAMDAERWLCENGC